MSDDKNLKTLRLICIERAVGELRAALQTFWEDQDEYVEFKKALDEFSKGLSKITMLKFF